MIYQILFVFALLIVALNDVSAAKLKLFTKEQLDAIYEKQPKSTAKTIEWSSWAPCTKDLPLGLYHLYKKDNDVWTLVCSIAIKSGEKFFVSDSNGYNVNATYVLYGYAHKDMKFGVDNKPTLESLDKLKGKVKFIRSEEKCFKNVFPKELKKLKVDAFDKKIEWCSWPTRTKELPRGVYGVYKKDGDNFTLFDLVITEGGHAMSLLLFKDFNWDNDYVIYGLTHKEMKIEPDESGKLIAHLDSVSSDQMELIRSEEKCFKSSSWLMKKELTKEDIEAINNEYKKTIEWSSSGACTMDLSVGFYALYKKDGKVWTFVGKFAIKRGEEIIVSDLNDFNVDTTYVVYGIAHKDMEFEYVQVDGEKSLDISNGDELSEDDLKFIRSEEKCFKNNKNNCIINGVIVAAVVLALCACCVFAFWYFKKRNRRN